MCALGVQLWGEPDTVHGKQPDAVHGQEPDTAHDRERNRTRLTHAALAARWGATGTSTAPPATAPEDQSGTVWHLTMPP